MTPVGRSGLDRRLAIIADDADERVPSLARASLRMLVAQYHLVREHILATDRALWADSRSTELGRRLQEIAGVGPLIASAFVACVPDLHSFRCGRSLSAWLGLVPRHNSSGGKDRLGRISKAGNGYLRQLLFVGAMAVIRYAQRHGTQRGRLIRLLARRTPREAAIAMANKNARIIWKLMTRGERYREEGTRRPSRHEGYARADRGWPEQASGDAAASRQGPIDPGEPSCARASVNARFRSGPGSAEGIMASGPWIRPHQQVEDMAAPNQPSCRSPNNCLPTERRPDTGANRELVARRIDVRFWKT